MTSGTTAAGPMDATRSEQGDLRLRGSTEIQGNVLAAFNKDHVVFLMVEFPDSSRARSWLGQIAPRVATTADVATFNRQFKAARDGNGGDDPRGLKAVWIALSLTAPGITMLAPALESDLGRFEAFRGGPAQRAEQLGDSGPSSPTRWVFGGPGQPPVHALVTVAAEEPVDLLAEVDKQRSLAARHGLSVVFEQRGDTLPGRRAGHEHFGFKDGISQPGIAGFTLQVRRHDREEDARHPGSEILPAGEFVLGHERVAEPPAQENPLGGPEFTPEQVPEWMRDGSFHVFRRLAQDVPGWWSQVTRNSESLPEDDPVQADRLAAKLVGRWRSGTPLALAPDRDNRSARDRRRDNDFDYDNDDLGHATPRFAHIRKMYPRSEKFHDDKRRILRRGIPFGAPFDPAAGRGAGVDADRGLLFSAYMLSIRDQFEFLQQSWANFPQFPGVVDRVEPLDDGPDPVIGTSAAGCRLRRQGTEDRLLDFQRFVHTSGAVYAFAPSLPTLYSLAEGRFDR